MIVTKFGLDWFSVPEKIFEKVYDARQTTTTDAKWWQ